MYSWGAGESGQLGTGRSTRKELPSKFAIPGEDDNTRFTDVACGYGHGIATSEDGRLVSWGLNHRGQLGCGDNTKRFVPVVTSDLNIKKVFAFEHSSAAINNSGQLLTWGNNDNLRLMQTDAANFNQTHFTSPVLVSDSVLDGLEIHSFAFSMGTSALFVPSTLTSVIYINIHI